VNLTAIIIPCFNDGATIEQAVASALTQPNTELVVINDGSSDPGTLAALERLTAAGVRVLDQPNQGVAVARMTGVRATEAPLILPLDADDLLKPGAVELLERVLTDDPELSFAWGDAEYFGDRQGRLRTSDMLDPWQITIFNTIPVTALIRRDALLQAGGWQPGWYEDWDLWLAFAECGLKGCRVDSLIFDYRFHGVRRSDSNRRHHDDGVARLRLRHQSLYAATRLHRHSSPLSTARKVVLGLAQLAPIGNYRRAVIASLTATGQIGNEFRKRLEKLGP